MDEVLDWLPALFERRREDGERRWSDAEKRDFLAAMILAFGYDAEDLTPEVQSLLADLALRAGVDPTASRADAEATLQQYFRDRPLDPELVREFQHNLRAALVDASGGVVTKVIAKYLEAGAPARFEPRAEPREGAVKGGPLGFFLAKKKLGE
ncbi:hypothetical protein L6R52_23800 [Myxococcota bacterium]|nr:hypothetical protein [Myxococcota bacterium]